MKILSDEQIREYYLGMRLSAVQRVCEAQARETCKEIGEKMMRRSDFEAMRLVLLRGEMP